MSTVFYGYQLAPACSPTLILAQVRVRVARHLESPESRFADGDRKPVAPIMVRVFDHAHYGTYVEPRCRYEWMIDGAFDHEKLTPVAVDTRSDDVRPTKRALAVVDTINGMILARQYLLYPLIDADDLAMAGWVNIG